jgi:hypothetical protein
MQASTMSSSSSHKHTHTRHIETVELAHFGIILQQEDLRHVLEYYVMQQSSEVLIRTCVICKALVQVQLYYHVI